MKEWCCDCAGIGAHFRLISQEIKSKTSTSVVKRTKMKDQLIKNNQAKGIQQKGNPKSNPFISAE